MVSALLLLHFLFSNVVGMIAFPAHRAYKDWAPRQQIKANYYTETATPMQAQFIINTTIPTVNIDNFPHIAAVNCLEDNSTILLHFTDPEAAQNAYKQWYSERASKNMSLYVNHHYNCFGNEIVQARHVNSMYLEGQSLRVDTHWLNHTEIYGNYELRVGEYFQEEHQSNSALVKRDSLQTKVYDFNVNYKNGSIVDSNFSLFDFRKNVILQYPRIAGRCINCHTKGNVSFSMYIKTTDGHISYYQIRAKGYFHANTDFQLVFPKAADKRMISFAPFFEEIGPTIYVPGLFFCGLQFGLVGSWAYAANLPFHLLFGFETTKAFDVVIESPPVKKHELLPHLAHVPNVTRLPTVPSVNKYHKSSMENTTDISYVLHVSPMLDLSLRAFQTTLLNFRLSFDSAVGLETRRGNARICTNVEQDYAMYTRETFNFDIGSGMWGLSVWKLGIGWNGFALWRKHFELWATSYIPIKCDFCAEAEKCPAGSLNLNGTKVEGGKLDKFS